MNYKSVNFAILVSSGTNFGGGEFETNDKTIYPDFSTLLCISQLLKVLHRVLFGILCNLNIFPVKSNHKSSFLFNVFIPFLCLQVVKKTRSRKVLEKIKLTEHEFHRTQNSHAQKQKFASILHPFLLVLTAVKSLLNAYKLSRSYFLTFLR